MSETSVMVSCPSCGAPLSFAERLATGVYGARCCARWVVKVRPLADTPSWESHERFERAARWLSESAHLGFPRVHAFDPNGAFLLSERLDRSLADGLLDARALLRGILEPLAAMHRSGFTHGTLAAENVMFRGERVVLTSCGAFARDGDPAEDVRAAALIARAARRDSSPPELLAMIAIDRRSRPRDAIEALAFLDGAPLWSATRTRLAAGATIALTVMLTGLSIHAAESRPSHRVEPKLVPGTCRIVSDPPGAKLFLGDRNVVWSAEHPLERVVGETPWVVARENGRPLIIHASGRRPFVLEMTSPREGEAPCVISVKLAAE